MKKKELAARLARQSQLTKAAAADQLDQIVHEILTKLKRGKPVSLPGLGTFTPGTKAGFAFEPLERKGAPKRGK